jgi:hypothetical protein
LNFSILDCKSLGKFTRAACEYKDDLASLIKNAKFLCHHELPHI